MSKTRWVWAVLVFGLCLCAATTAFAADSWNLMGQDFPTGIVWDQTQAVSVDAQNDGDTTWTSSFNLRPVDSPTAAAILDRDWGVTSVPLVGTISPGMTYKFAFGITAPPLTTLEYALPLTPTTPPTVATLPADWVVAHGTTPIATDLSTNDVTIERFPDILPSTGNTWAAAYIEELAGRVPSFVSGFPDGTYQPSVPVTRDQMAVFIARAVAGGDQFVPTGPATATFPDVPTGYWAFKWVEAAVAGDIVQGYPDGSYHPVGPVTRDQMAVFVSRGIAGGDASVTGPPSTSSFPDIPTNFWAFKYIEYAVAHHIVTGYPDGTYQAALPVTRAQMAVFVYRGFIQPTGSVVVLAGPDVNEQGTGSAYIGFDAVRLTPDTPLTVTFELSVDEDTPPVATHTETISPADIATAQAAVATHFGQPYFYVVWDARAAVAPGTYVLTTTVNGVTLARTAEYVIAP